MSWYVLHTAVSDVTFSGNLSCRLFFESKLLRSSTWLPLTHTLPPAWHDPGWESPPEAGTKMASRRRLSSYGSDGEAGQPRSLFAVRTGDGIGFLSNELDEGEVLSQVEINPSLASLASRFSRSLNLNNPETSSSTIVEEASFSRFGDLPPELRNKVYYFYAADRGNIPSSAITLGYAIDKTYHRTKRPFPLNLNITLVSKLVRTESLPIIGAELATRVFHMTHYDATMLQSPVEQAMLPIFGRYIQSMHLARGGVLRCLKALVPHSPALKTVDVQLATHPWYRRTAVNHEFPDDMGPIDVQLKLDDDAEGVMQTLLDKDKGVKGILRDYRKAKKAHPNVFVQGRQWKVRFVIRVYMKEVKEDEARWRYKVTFEAETGKVVQAVRLPTEALEMPDLRAERTESWVDTS